MSASVIVTIIVIALLLFFLFWGYHKGFFCLILTTMAFVVTIILASLLTPRLCGTIQDSFIGKSIEENINGFIDNNIRTEIVDQVGSVQTKLIDSLPLPGFIQKNFNEDNTPEKYAELKVNSFSEYLKTRLNNLAVNVVTYIILSVGIYLAIRILLRIFRVLNKVPVIGGINRFLGAIVGLAEGLLIIWLACLVVMLLANTPFGMEAAKIIQGNSFLKFLYDNNGIIIGANALFKTFL